MSLKAKQIPERETLSDRILSSVGVFSFPSLFTPRINKLKPNEAGKYEVSVVFPPGTDHSKLEKLIADAAEEYFNGKLPPTWKNPLRFSKDKEHLGEPYVDGGRFFTAKSNYAPGIVDNDMQDVIDQKQVYPGVIGRVQVHTYGYNTDGNKGIGIGLDHVQIVQDGTPIGDVRTEAADQFTKVEIDDLM